MNTPVAHGGRPADSFREVLKTEWLFERTNSVTKLAFMARKLGKILHWNHVMTERNVNVSGRIDVPEPAAVITELSVKYSDKNGGKASVSEREYYVWKTETPPELASIEVPGRIREGVTVSSLGLTSLGNLVLLQASGIPVRSARVRQFCDDKSKFNVLMIDLHNDSRQADDLCAINKHLEQNPPYHDNYYVAHSDKSMIDFRGNREGFPDLKGVPVSSYAKAVYDLANVVAMGSYPGES